MKKTFTILLLFFLVTSANAQWDEPTDRFYANGGGLNYLDLTSTMTQFSFNAGSQVEQVAVTLQECNLVKNPNVGVTIMGAAIAIRTLTINGSPGSVTVKLMRADGANLCNNDSFLNFSCVKDEYLKKQPGTLIHQQTFSLSNASIKAVPDQNGLSFASFVFANGGVNYNSSEGPIYVLFDFSSIGDDAIGLAYTDGPYLGNDVYMIKDSACWKNNKNWDFVILPLMKNDPYMIYSKKVTKCLPGPYSYEKFFTRTSGSSVFVCENDSVLFVPSARYGFGKMVFKQSGIQNLPFISMRNNYPIENCNETGFPYVESGYLVPKNQSAQYSFVLAADSNFTTNLLTINGNVNFVDYPTVTTNQNLSVCAGNVQLNATVTGPANTLVWRGGTFSDTSIANPILTAVKDTVITITATTNSGSCESSKNIQVTIKKPYNQPICMVSVDSTASHNVVVWEKVANSDVDSFFVYREITTNNYQKIAGRSFSQITEFADLNANPNQQAYRYRIVVKDVCGNTGAIESSNYHNTIHLQNQGNGNFNWNNYIIEGQPTVVASYNFWRDSLGNGNWRKIATVPGTQNTYTDGQFSSLSNASYRVEVNWLNSKTCNSLLKRKTIYSSSLSNIIKLGSGTGVEDELASSFSCFPNPADQKLFINNHNGQPINIQIFNSIGEKVYEISEINSKEMSIDISTFTNGIYYVNAQQKQYTYSLKLIVIH